MRYQLKTNYIMLPGISHNFGITNQNFPICKADALEKMMQVRNSCGALVAQIYTNENRAFCETQT